TRPRSDAFPNSCTAAIVRSTSCNPESKIPGGSRRGFFTRQLATLRSRIEIAVHAEAELPVVDVGFRQVSVSKERCAHRAPVCAMKICVHSVETHVEVLGDVPLGSRADPPGAPIE